MVLRQCSICGSLYEEGKECMNPSCVAIRKKRIKQKNRNYNQKRYAEDKDYVKFYSSSHWMKVRDICRMKQGIDLWLYFQKGIIKTDSLYVHHIYPVKEFWNRRYDLNNLICLGFESHEYIHSIYSKSKLEKEKLQKLLESYVKQWEEIKGLE